MLVEVTRKNRIAELREAKGLTRAQLARRADMSEATVNAAEIPQRSPRWETAKKIAGALGVPTEEIYIA